MRTLLARLLATSAAAVVVGAGAVTDASPATAQLLSLDRMLDQLVVTAESGGQDYRLDRFQHWTDADGDGCHTRAEVLIAESLTPPTVDPACGISGGVWTSWLDSQTWTDLYRLVVDHTVPLEEAWSSGAAGWSADQRRDYANDLAFRWSLETITETVDLVKGAKDPAEWMPPTNVACTYASAWIGIKYRWRLSVDPAEKAALVTATQGCGLPPMDVPRADVPEPPGSIAGTDRMAAGQQLHGGQWLMSANRTHGLTLQTDGNLVAYGPNSRVLWDSGTPGRPGSVLTMQADGNLVVYSAGGRPLWNAGTYGNPGATVKVQDDGNVVVYRTDGSAAWFSGWDRSSLFPGQDLRTGQRITSPNGRHQLVLQPDGNAVVYVSDGRPLFFTGSYWARQLRLQPDGNLVALDQLGRALWHAGTWRDGPTRLDVQDDGNVVLYRADGTPAWYSGWDGGQRATSPGRGTLLPR